jgi:hypothetical protein
VAGESPSSVGSLDRRFSGLTASQRHAQLQQQIDNQEKGDAIEDVREDDEIESDSGAAEAGWQEHAQASGYFHVIRPQATPSPLKPSQTLPSPFKADLAASAPLDTTRLQLHEGSAAAKTAVKFDEFARTVLRPLSLRNIEAHEPDQVCADPDDAPRPAVDAEQRHHRD